MTGGNFDHNQRRQVERITWIGLFTNLLLSGLKFFLGFFGSSQAVVADAVHSLSDMSTDIAILFGVKYWMAPPDEDHPYGHLRIETLITTVIGIVLAIVAFGIGFRSLYTIREPHLKQPMLIALIGPLLSIVFKEVLYRRTVSLGKRIESSALIANAWHHRSDALSSIPALIAVVLAALNPAWAFIDHVGALVVAVIILRVSWGIIKPAMAELTDRGASRLELQKVQEITMSTKGVRAMHGVRTRKMGAGLFVDLHILVDSELTVREGHNISEEVKRGIIKKGPGVFDVVVHLEPYE